MKFVKPLIPMLVLGACLAGCRSNRVIFVTQTSLGLDVSGTAQVPNKVSLSYNRFEGAIVPRKTNGEAHSVYGGLDADVRFFKGHTIKQTFSTGKAAMLATGASTNGLANSSTTATNSLVFLTGTTYGLHLTAGEQSTPPNLLLGYRRSEMAVIPICDPAEEVRSVYADLLISTETNNPLAHTNVSAIGGVRMKQSFATGKAADALVTKNAEVKQKLDAAAGADGTSALLRRNQAKAVALADDIDLEVDRLDGSRLQAGMDAFVQTRFLDRQDATELSQRRDVALTKKTLKRAVAEQLETPEITTRRLDDFKALFAKLRTINSP